MNTDIESASVDPGSKWKWMIPRAVSMALVSFVILLIPPVLDILMMTGLDLSSLVNNDVFRLVINHLMDLSAIAAALLFILSSRDKLVHALLAVAIGCAIFGIAKHWEDPKAFTPLMITLRLMGFLALCSGISLIVRKFESEELHKLAKVIMLAALARVAAVVAVFLLEGNNPKNAPPLVVPLAAVATVATYLLVVNTYRMLDPIRLKLDR